MAGLIGHEGTQAVPPVLFVTVSTGRGYVFGSTSAMLVYGGAPELSDEEVRRLDAQDLAQRRDNVAAGRHLAVAVFCRFCLSEAAVCMMAHRATHLNEAFPSDSVSSRDSLLLLSCNGFPIACFLCFLSEEQNHQ